MSEKLQLDLPIVLPDVPDARDACVARLNESLASSEGVERVHVIDPENGEPAKLCIHYDPTVVSLARIRQMALRNGARITDKYGHVLWRVRGIGYQHRARTVSEWLRRVPGVLEGDATAAGLIHVEYDRSRVDEGQLESVLGGLGIDVVQRRSHAMERRSDEQEAEGKPETGAERREDAHKHGEHDHRGIFGENTELIFAILSGVCVATGWVLQTLAGLSAGIPTGIFIAGYFFGGWYTLREAFDAVRIGRFEIDFLMLVAAVGAAALGVWFEGALLLFLFSLGHSLEHYAMGRARRAIESLADLAPETAIVRRDGEEKEIPVEELVVGDTVIVRSNERLPADGIVVRGNSDVNQAPVTGESVPVDKTPVENDEDVVAQWDSLGAEHRVFAGTINGSGSLEIVVAKQSDESTLARVVEAVANAETRKSKTQRFAEHFERIFVPAVLGLVVLLLFAWLVVDETFGASFYRAMAVLVAASPCALAIATPSAVLSGVARAGRGGVLIKGGGPLQHLSEITAIAFDKTGTLTAGRPRVTDIVPAEGSTDDELLRTLVSVELLSDHPLAQAVVKFSKERLDGQMPKAEATEFESLPGRGVRAVVEGESVLVGKKGLFTGNGEPKLPQLLEEEIERLQSEGRATMIARRGDRFLGVVGLMDTARESAPSAIGRLRNAGIGRMILISGDSRSVAESVGEDVGVDEAHGDLMPDDKVEFIRKLSRDENVAMVGDGVNDAPAMSAASIGIAMGAAGSDVALETADVALMADSLKGLPFAVGLGRTTGRIIRQNLWISLGMVAVLIPATILGLHIGPAVALHEGSTLLVVVNALRLLAYSDGS